MPVYTSDPFPGFKFGCDPELFVVDDKGQYVTAEGLIPGTKANPYPVEGGAVQVDGMAAEFNIDPAYTFEEFSGNIDKVMKTLKKMLPAGYSLAAVPAVTFSQEEWDRAPDVAKILGCTPDFNAWTGEPNCPPEDLENPTLRTASGHIHIGWRDDGEIDMDHVKNCQDLVKQLDFYLGAWSLQKDPDPTRRRLYGKAGACRYKPYGVEYRVLSNFWIVNKPSRRLVWNRMQSALFDMQDSFVPARSEAWNRILIHSIDNSDRDKFLEATFNYPILHV